MAMRMGLWAWLFGLAPAAAWAGGAEHWVASSNAASAITGDMTVRADRIVFAGGAALPIAAVRTIDFTDDLNTTLPATLYRVTRPADPALLGRNHLCSGAVTYVVLWRTPPIMPGGGAGRAMASFSGTQAPAPTIDHACGVLRYELAP